MRIAKLLIFLFCVIFAECGYKDNTIERETCSLKPELLAEIKSYKPIADKIINSIINGKYKESTYNHLATFVDKFGPRFTGTQNLENAIDYMVYKSKKFDLENVRTENVTVPHWIRGNESATLLSPRFQNLRMLGLGSSVGTPKEGITAEAIVVHDFDELKRNKDAVKGKIVIYDEDFISYGDSVIYRVLGASKAAKFGAVAALVSSITPFSLNTPHTGMQSYEKSVKKIPVACITPEDAHMLRRIQKRGNNILIHLKMDAQNLPPTISRNTIAEIQGSSIPEKVVVVSGHLDSWDVGQGAMDDGGGAFLSWNTLVVLKSLGLRPKRTLRAILWTAEEMGIVGAQSYVNDHKHELDNFDFVMESDLGTFKPLGLAFSGTQDAMCIIQAILGLCKEINTTTIKQPHEGPDIEYFVKLGVPGASLLNDNEIYFIFHHTEADTMDVEDPKSLDLSTALWATVSYVVADLSIDIPKVLKL